MTPAYDGAPIPLQMLEVAGDYREMGRATGEALRPLIQGFVTGRLTALRANLLAARQGSSDLFKKVADEGLRSLAQWDPNGFSELEACAAAAGVSTVDLYAAASLTDFRDVILYGAEPFRGAPWTSTAPASDAEGCSSLAQAGSSSGNGHLLCGQTWDLNPPDLDFVVALHRRPKSGPESWTITCAGCPAIVGLNAAGVYVGTTNIKTYGAVPAASYVSLIYRALRETTLEGAVECIASAPRSGAHTYLIADAQHAVELETDTASIERRDLTATAPLCRTNHCLSATFTAKAAEAPSTSSLARKQRLEAAAATPLDIDALKTLFANREDGVDSLNRYPEDNQGTATNAVIIYDSAARTLHVCRGPADRGAWHTLRLDTSCS